MSSLQDLCLNQIHTPCYSALTGFIEVCSSKSFLLCKSMTGKSRLSGLQGVTSYVTVEQTLYCPLGPPISKENEEFILIAGRIKSGSR